ncbi:hypothetical protein ES705_21672 [subsurface metagenome]
MPEKIEIIYDFDGFANQRIKNVEVSRVNGYRTIITKEGKEKMVYQLKNITEANVKRIIECADFKGIDIEEIIKSINKIKEVKIKMTEKTDDEIRFTEEEKKVNAFLEKNPKMSYRDAVTEVLDRTEPKPKKEFTEEEIKKRENLKAVENYISANPRATYKEAVKVVLRGEELTLEEKLIEEYLEKNPGSDYKEAVIESLSLLEKEPKKKE